MLAVESGSVLLALLRSSAFAVHNVSTREKVCLCVPRAMTSEASGVFSRLASGAERGRSIRTGEEDTHLFHCRLSYSYVFEAIAATLCTQVRVVVIDERLKMEPNSGSTCYSPPRRRPVGKLSLATGTGVLA